MLQKPREKRQYARYQRRVSSIDCWRVVSPVLCHNQKIPCFAVPNWTSVLALPPSHRLPPLKGWPLGPRLFRYFGFPRLCIFAHRVVNNGFNYSWRPPRALRPPFACAHFVPNSIGAPFTSDLSHEPAAQPPFHKKPPSASRSPILAPGLSTQTPC